MDRIIDITKARDNLLKLSNTIENDGNIILARNNIPVAVLQNIKDYEKNYISNETKKKKITLIIAAAKDCDENTAIKSINNINKLFNKTENPYLKTIFVYSKQTKKYLAEFNIPLLYSIENYKYKLPLITTIKCAMSGLYDEDFFVLTFLSHSFPIEELVEIGKKIEHCNKGIIIRIRNDKPSHPIAFSIKYKKYFLSTRKELGIPYIIKKFKTDIEYI